MNDPCAVVFDLDGTLVDAFADIAAAINAPLAARGFPTHTAERIKTMVGDGAGKLIERAIPAEAQHLFGEIREEMMARYEAHPADHAVIYDGILPALDAMMARGAPMAVLSNKPHRMTLKTCEQLGLTGYFRAIQGEDGEQEVPRKPDPAGLRILLRRLAVSRAILVGDGVPDGRLASNAGIPFVACLWGASKRADLEAFSPVAIAERPRELEEVLSRLLG